MNKDLLKVSIRQNAIYLPLIEEEKKQEELTSTTIALVAQLRKVGYSLSEELLHAVNQLYPAQQMMILQVMKEAKLGSIGERVGCTYRRNAFGSSGYMDR